MATLFDKKSVITGNNKQNNQSDFDAIENLNDVITDTIQKLTVFNKVVTNPNHKPFVQHMMDLLQSLEQKTNHVLTDIAASSSQFRR